MHDKKYISSVNFYLKNIEPLEILTASKERELISKYKETNDNKYINKLVNKSQYIIIDEVIRFSKYQINILDLIQYANLFTIQSLKNYSIDKGNVKNYIHRHVHYKLQNVINNLILPVSVPANVYEEYITLFKEINILTSLYNRCLYYDEIWRLYQEILGDKNHINFKYDILNSILYQNIYSINNDNSELLYKKNSKNRKLRYESLKKSIYIALSTLKTVEKDIIRLYYGIDRPYALSLQDIGDKYDFTRERARQIKECGINKLKHITRAKLLKDFLGDDKINKIRFNINKNNLDFISFKSLYQKEAIRLLKKYIKPTKRDYEYKNLSALQRKIALKYIMKKNRPCSYNEIFNHVKSKVEKTNNNNIYYSLKSSKKIKKNKNGLYYLNITQKHKNKKNKDSKKKKNKNELLNNEYEKILSENNIEIKEEFKIIFDQMRKKNGSISNIRLNSLSSIKNIDLKNVIFSISKITKNIYAKELIQYNEDIRKWEINPFFNYIPNWKKSNKSKNINEPKIKKERYKVKNKTKYTINKQVPKLKETFKRMTNSYKIYWMESIITLVKNHRKKADLYTVASLMCAHAWSDVLINNKKFSKNDQIPLIINKIYLKSNLGIKKDDNIAKIKNYIIKNKGKYKGILKNLIKYVPYRFLSVYVPEAKNKKDAVKNKIISKKMNESNLMYRIKDDILYLNKDWRKYILNNRKKLKNIINKYK